MSRPHRLAGFSYTGPCRYFLTFCAFERNALFRDGEVVALALQQFRTTATAERFAILAYCFMPDHAHLLVEGLTDAADLCRFARLARQRSGALYARTRKRRLWQEGYYDRILRRDDDARAFARYILANPVRAGLVSSPAEYVHLGSDTWPVEELLASCS